MQNNFSIDSIADTLKKAETISQLLSQDKNGLIDLVISKKPELSSVLSLVNASKGGMSSLFQNIAQNKSNVDLTSTLLPFMMSMNKTKAADSKTSNEKMPQGHYLAPIVSFASGEILKDILLLLTDSI